MRRTRSLRLLCALVLALALGACESSGGGDGTADTTGGDTVTTADAGGVDTTVPDAGSDAGLRDVTPTPDLGGGDVAADAGGTDALPPADWVGADAAPDVAADTHTGGPFEPRPVAAGEPTPVAADAWLIGMLPLGDTDPVGDALAAGTFTMPTSGTDADGVRWIATTTGERGAITGFPQNTAYAAASVPVPAGERLFVRVDKGIDVYGDGLPQPADIYGHRTSRLPLPATFGGADGDAAVVVYRAFGQRGAPEIELWSTPHELVYNLADRTFPDLVAGDDTERWLGVAVLNMTERPGRELRAWVVESEHFEATEVVYPSLPPGAAVQVGFLLRPKAGWPEPPPPPTDPDAEPETLTIPVTVRLGAPAFDWSYEATTELTVVDPATPYRQTFRSPVDGSVQYYGVRTPSEPAPDTEYAAVLSLHGAGVDAIGLTRAYGAKPWAYIINPTNRRRFGFDWEEWGRLNALASLDDAMARFPIRDTRVYLTGHSMGGHGTWHVGVTTPTRFAVLGPSAGWASFYTYVGRDEPTGAFGRARAHSDTLQYLTNLSERAAFIIHGEADDNVPVREGRDMYDRLQDIVAEDDLVYYEEPGAGHWWDGDLAPGADCVDFPLLFRFMDERRVDPSELTFSFTTPMASYNPHHSFVTLRSCADPYENCTVTAAPDGTDDTHLVMTTQNVRSMVLDGDALVEKGVATVTIDADPALADAPEDLAVQPGPIAVGPQDGKRPGQHGPYNEVYRRPFCWVYGDGAVGFRAQASYLASTWTVVGNGHSCALPVSALTDDVRRDYNLVYVGVPRDAVPTDLPFDWDEAGVSVDGARFDGAAVMFVFPEGEGLSAVLHAPAGSEYLLSWIVPFSSRSGMPDYLVWSPAGAHTTGFFAADWSFDRALGFGL